MFSPLFVIPAKEESIKKVVIASPPPADEAISAN